ncbi:MAG: murein L,D-transpeptidase catalytic domain family protein [Bdellovibrionales bacterium]|nr:murein L,D-transpeptidase catalytic domain family protein [Bdellovibrionales bacterium]
MSSVYLSAAHASTTLDEALDQLYDSVAAKFVQNRYFHNSADPDLARIKNLKLPDFQMMDKELFRSSMKSYCTLLESPNGKKVKNTARFGIVNFTENSGVRRFFIYDVAGQQMIHNIWVAHGGNTRFSQWYSLKDVDENEFGGMTKEVVLSGGDVSVASLFSNRNGSNQSSVGMAIAASEPYYSAENGWNALRLTGVDGALNSNLKPRAVVFHEWNYTSQMMGYYLSAPLSEGCPMLPTRGYYQGQYNVEIARKLMSELYSAPVLFYHDRMNAADNEAGYNANFEEFNSMKQEISDNMKSYAEDYKWTPENAKKYESTIQTKFDTAWRPLIEETYKYFKNKSAYYGVEPKNEAACRKALGI